MGFMGQRLERLKKNAVERYEIKPEEVHVGHLALEGLLDRPMHLNQIDAATDSKQANIALAVQAMQLASAMDNFGLKIGDVVVLIGRGHLDTSVVFYATHFMGYTVCTMDPELDNDDISRLYGKIKPKLTFTIDYCLEKVNNALVANDMEIKVVVFEEKDNDLETFIKEYKGTVINFRPAVGFDHTKVPAWFMLTSGTTGPPKAAIVPYDRTLNAGLSWWDGEFDVAASVMVLSSLQWVTTLVTSIVAPIVGVTRITTSQPPNLQIILQMINKYRPEATILTPSLLARFAFDIPQNICNLSCFKHIVVGGVVVERKILEGFKKICSANLFYCFGMSELLVSIFKVEDMSTIPLNTCGKAMEQFEYKLIGDNGDEITEPNKNGELWVRGYGFFTGYHEDPKETDTVLTADGWLKTGDIFYRDENDFFYYVERKKLIIRYMMFNVSPLEIEDLIRKHPGVAETCVVGIPNSSTHELVVAAILKKPGHDVNPQEIFELVKNTLPDRKHLHGGLFFVDSFPVTIFSKICRSKVIRMAREAQRIMPEEGNHQFNQ